MRKNTNKKRFSLLSKLIDKLNAIKHKVRTAEYNRYFLNDVAEFGFFSGAEAKAQEKIAKDLTDKFEKEVRGRIPNYTKEVKDQVSDYWKKLRKSKKFKLAATGYAGLAGLQALSGLYAGGKIIGGVAKGVKHLTSKKEKTPNKKANFSANLMHVRPVFNNRVRLSGDEIKQALKIGGIGLGVPALGGYGLHKLNQYRKRRKTTKTTSNIVK